MKHQGWAKVLTGGLVLLGVWMTAGQIGQAAEYELSAWASVTPTIDGRPSPGEWVDAYKQFFVTTGGAQGFVYVKNDDVNLYIGFVTQDATFSTGHDSADYVTVSFDNDNDGDRWEAGHDGISWLGSDWHDECVLEVDGRFLVRWDEAGGGRKDGDSAGSGDGTHNYFEFRHPLNSGDACDISVSYGDRIGFAFYLVVDGVNRGWAPRETASEWADIIIASPVRELAPIESHPPTAALRLEPANPVAGEPIRFIDESTDPDGDIVAWAWEFGNGQASWDRQPTQTYAHPGTYVVRLDVTDEAGNTNGIFHRLTVAEPSAPPSDGGASGLSDYDANANCRLENGEFLAVIDDWIGGVVEDPILFGAMDAWIAQSSVCLEAALRGEVLSIVAETHAHMVSFATRARNVAMFEVDVYDLAGRQLAHQAAAGRALDWDLRSNDGRPVASGVYLYRAAVRTLQGELRRTGLRMFVLLRGLPY